MTQRDSADEPTSTKTGDLALGRRIAERRRELDMSRKDLAAATELSYPYIAQIETGYRSPSMKHQFSIARALGLSLDELFGTPDEGLVFPAAPPPPQAPGIVAGSAPSRSASRRTSRRASLDEVIERAAAEIESLPASVRLEALSRIQLQIMQGVTDEQARRRS